MLVWHPGDRSPQPVGRLEVKTAGGWRKLHRTDYNYFLSPDGSGCGKAIRITDIYGQQLTINGIALKPDVKQPTRVQFASIDRGGGAVWAYAAADC